MWQFKGTYTGKAKEYVKAKEKKQITVWFWTFSIVLLLIFSIMAIGLGDGDIKIITIIASIGLATIIFAGLSFFIYYKRDEKCVIEIKNDGFYGYDRTSSISFAFYKITSIDYHEDFIVIKTVFKRTIVLQKELLIKGDWEKLKSLLKKVEDSLATDEPMYQIEEPGTEFLKATVREKRIYQKFVGGVSTITPVGLFHYFVTFERENDIAVEFEVGRVRYEKMEKGQKGTLVLVNGNFFAFETEEEI